MNASLPAQRRWEVGSEHFRMVLGERWAPGPMIGFVGMNPSYASEERTDHTWSAWRGFALRWGAGGQIVVNPHPGRNSDPAAAIDQLIEMRAGRAPDVKTALERNLVSVRVVAGDPVAWVIGWGDKGAKMNEVVRIHAPFMEALTSCPGGQRILAFGFTADRNPKHVLARGRSRIPPATGLFEYSFVGRRLSAHVDPEALFRP